MIEDDLDHRTLSTYGITLNWENSEISIYETHSKEGVRFKFWLVYQDLIFFLSWMELMSLQGFTAKQKISTLQWYMEGDPIASIEGLYNDWKASGYEIMDV